MSKNLHNNRAKSVKALKTFRNLVSGPYHETGLRGGEPLTPWTLFESYGSSSEADDDSESNISGSAISLCSLTVME